MGLKSCLPSRRHPAECREDCSCPPCCWESSTGERRRVFTRRQQRKPTHTVSEPKEPSYLWQPIHITRTYNQKWHKNRSELFFNVELLSRTSREGHRWFACCIHWLSSICFLFIQKIKNTSRKSHQRSEFYFFLHFVPKKGTESVANHLLERL